MRTPDSIKQMIVGTKHASVAAAVVVACASPAAMAGAGDAVSRMERVSNNLTTNSVTVVGGATAAFGPFRLGADRPAILELGNVVNYSGVMADVSNTVKANVVTVVNALAKVGTVQQGKP